MEVTQDEYTTPYLRRSIRAARGVRRRTPKSTVLVARRPYRIPRSLRPSAVKDFSFTYQPFNLALMHGIAGGINFYSDGSIPVPTAPVGIGFGGTNFSFNFSLSQMQTLINGTGAATNGGFTPNVNVSEYTNLFDSYRLCKVEIQMVYNASDQTQTMTTGMPNIMLVNDYDDSQNTGIASLCQYSSFKLLQMQAGRRKTWKMTPRLQSAVETTSGSVLSMTPARGAWIDTLTPNAQYFGVKGAWDCQNFIGATTNVGYVTFYVKVFVQFKNTK